MLIFCAGCKERREFSLKMCAGCHQSIRAACRCTSICCLCCAFRSRCCLCLAGAIAASAASQRTGHHGKRKQSCKSLVRLFHVNPPYICCRIYRFSQLFRPCDRRTCRLHRPIFFSFRQSISQCLNILPSFLLSVNPIPCQKYIFPSQSHTFPCVFFNVFQKCKCGSAHDYFY